MAALNEMPRAVAEHEVAHLLGACIAFIGDANPRMKHFCEHPRFHDAHVYLGFDAAAGQGEFAIVVNKFVPHQPEMPDETLAMIRRSSAIAPIGLVRDQSRILRCVREAKHWLDVLNAQREMTQALYNVADTEFGHQLAKLKLMLLTGDITVQQLSAIHD